MDDGGETRPGTDDIDGTASDDVGDTFNRDSDGGTRQGGASLAPSPVEAQRWLRPWRLSISLAQVLHSSFVTRLPFDNIVLVFRKAAWQSCE